MIRRFFRHLRSGYWQASRIFPQTIRTRLAEAIRRAELGHAGEICFVIEASLAPSQLWRDLSAHDRALELFSDLRLWDTEQNSGLLIYLLLADHAVEIVADRGLCREEMGQAWPDLLRDLQRALAAGEFEQGCLSAIDRAGQVLRQHFPAVGPDTNELPNRVPLL